MSVVKHKLHISYLIVLVFCLAQFVTLVHATDHPFHQDDAVCAVYQSAEQNKYIVDNYQLLTAGIVFITADILPAKNIVLSSVNLHYQQRAPPIDSKTSL